MTPATVTILSDKSRATATYFGGETAFWNDLYERNDIYGEIYRLRQALTLDYIDRLPLRQRAKVVDIGSGAGLLAIALARRGFEVTAVDSAPAMLQRTRQNAVAAGVEHLVTTVQADVQTVGLEPGGFELVVALGVLPWLHSPARAIRQMAHAVAPSGYLIFSADNKWRLNHLMDPLFTPALRPVRRAISRALRTPREQGTVTFELHSVMQLKNWLKTSSLECQTWRTFGFQPLTFFGRRLLPPSTDLALHRRFQRLADRNVPGLRMVGAQHLFVTRMRKHP